MEKRNLRNRRPVGRPRHKNRKEHLPNVVIRKNLIIEMRRLSHRSGECISRHFERAVESYLAGMQD